MRQVHIRIQPVLYRAHTTVRSRWLAGFELASVVISLTSSATADTVVVVVSP